VRDSVWLSGRCDGPLDGTVAAHSPFSASRSFRFVGILVVKIQITGGEAVSTQDGASDDRPSKDGPLSYAPKNVRRGGPEPKRGGAPGTDDVARLRQGPQAPGPTEQFLKRLNQRPVFAAKLSSVPGHPPATGMTGVPACRRRRGDGRRFYRLPTGFVVTITSHAAAGPPGRPTRSAGIGIQTICR
jgi:hypothetical protein